MFKRPYLHAAVAICAVTLSAVPAFAHAHPVTMNPAPDATVSAPTEISIVFSEELEPKFSSLKLADSNGNIVSKEASVVDPKNAKHMTLALPKLAPGVYTVQWMSSALDGHKMARSYSFTVK
jgi:methionine-rich copper-binding protein CopC